MARAGAVFTIIAKNYLAHARCLMDSVARFHPELSRFVILVDRVDGRFDPTAERFSIIPSELLDIPEEKWFHFKYTLIEACTAVKPFAIEYLFRKFGFDFVLYLDPDILVCADLLDILASLDRYSVVMTPHLTAAVHDGKRPSELDILRSGVYNLGFFAIARNEEAVAYLRWWKQRLHDYCVVDLPRGLFLDQRWADFAPCFLSRLRVLRDPGCNVAYWNLHERHLTIEHGSFLVNGSPLRFFHFSGFDPDHPAGLSKHQTRFQIRELPAVNRLADQYRTLLYDRGYGECRKWPYAYGCFKNGVHIPDLGRPLHHEAPGVTQSVSDPFSDQGYQAFVSIWNAPLEPTVSGRPMLTRLAYRLYRTRNDLQAAMPNVFNGDYRGFVRWLTSRATAEHDLPDVFLAPFRRDINGIHSSDRADSDKRLKAALPECRRPTLTRLAVQIYKKRPDLQAFFPDPCGEDATKYLVWLLSYGRRQYALSEAFIGTLQQQWVAEVERLPSAWARLRHRVLLKASIASTAVWPWLRGIVRAPFWLLVLVRARRSNGSADSLWATMSSDSLLPPEDGEDVALATEVTAAPGSDI